MPTAANLPTTSDVTAKLATQGVTLTTPQTNDIPSIIASVIAEFEAPPAPRGKGGTGRIISPVSATKYFDGTGTNTLYVPNIDSNQTVTIEIDNVPITDFVLVDSNDGTGVTVIERQLELYVGVGYMGGFVQGTQNVAITATWGLADAVPNDIYEAIRSEAAARLLIQQAGPIGYGMSVKTEAEDVRQSTSTASLNMLTSTITTWRQQFRDCIAAYRDRDYINRGINSRRMI